MEFSCLKIKKTTYISGGILQNLENQQKKSALKKSLFRMTLLQSSQQ